MSDRSRDSKGGGDAAEAMLELADQLEEQGRDLLRQAKELQKLAEQIAGSDSQGFDRPKTYGRGGVRDAQKPAYGGQGQSRGAPRPRPSGEAGENRTRSAEFRPRREEGRSDTRSGSGPSGARRGGERSSFKASGNDEWRTVEGKPRGASGEAGRSPGRTSRPGVSRGAPRGNRPASGFRAEGEWRDEGAPESRGDRRPGGGGGRPPSKGGGKKPGWTPKGGRGK